MKSKHWGAARKSVAPKSTPTASPLKGNNAADQLALANCYLSCACVAPRVASAVQNLLTAKGLLNDTSHTDWHRLHAVEAFYKEFLSTRNDARFYVNDTTAYRQVERQDKGVSSGCMHTLVMICVKERG